MNWDKVKIEYNPANEEFAEWRCPYCSRQFYGGGPVLHHPECLNKVDYDELVHIIGPAVVKGLLNSEYPTIDGLTLETLSKSEVGFLALKKHYQ